MDKWQDQYDQHREWVLDAFQSIEFDDGREFRLEEAYKVRKVLVPLAHHCQDIYQRYILARTIKGDKEHPLYLAYEISRSVLKTLDVMLKTPSPFLMEWTVWTLAAAIAAMPSNLFGQEE